MYTVNRTYRSQNKICTSEMRSAALTFQNAIVCISFLVVVSDCSVNSEEAFFSPARYYTLVRYFCKVCTTVRCYRKSDTIL